MSHRHPDSAHAEHGRIRRTFLQGAQEHMSAHPHRQWWVVWLAVMHGFFLLLGSLWSLVHRYSFDQLLPPLIPGWLQSEFAVGLLLVGLWLIASAMRTVVMRAARYVALATSGLAAVLCLGVAALTSVEGLYGVVGAVYGFFAVGWALLLWSPRTRSRRRTAY